MVIDFLTTKRSKEELSIALDVLREFKKNESMEEYIAIPITAWAKLEQLEEYLDYKVNGTPLAPDTLEVLKKHLL